MIFVSFESPLWGFQERSKTLLYRRGRTIVDKFLFVWQDRCSEELPKVVWISVSAKSFFSSIWLIILGLLEACPKTSVPPTAQNIWPIFVQKNFFFWSIFLMRISAALKFLRSVSKRKQKRVQNRPCRRDRDVFFIDFYNGCSDFVCFFCVFFPSGPLRRRIRSKKY